MSTDTLSPDLGPPGATRRRPAPRLLSGVSSLTRLRRWVSPVAIVLLWQQLSNLGVLGEEQIASPAQVGRTAVALAAEGTLQEATLVSVLRVLTGFVVGALIGVGLAVLAGLSRIGEDTIDPPMQVLRALPHLGLIPLFVVWMGVGEMPTIVLVAMGVTFPLYVHTVAGIRGADRKLLAAAETMHLTRAQRLRHVVLPGARPQTLIGMRLSLGMAWLSLVVAETVSPDAGLGQMVTDAREPLRTDVIVVGLVAYSLLGLLTDACVRLIERKSLSWR